MTSSNAPPYGGSPGMPRRRPSISRDERLGRLGAEVDDGRETPDPRERDLERLAPRPRSRRAAARTAGVKLPGRHERVEDRHVGRHAQPRRPVPAAAQALHRGRDADSDDDRALGASSGMADRVRCAHAARRLPHGLPSTIRRLGKVHHVALIVRSIEDVARPLARRARPRARDRQGHPVRPGPDRVPRGGRVEDRARRADRRHDRRRPLPREQGRGLPPRLLRGRRTSPRRCSASRSTASS